MKVKFIVVLYYIMLFIVFGVLFDFMVIYVLNKDSHGWYQVSTRTYTVKAKIGFENSTTVGAHEYGHDVWYYRINKSLRDEYKNIVNNNSTCKMEKKIKEDFAYSFEYYVEDVRYLFDCIEKVRFFDKIINEVS